MRRRRAGIQEEKELLLSSLKPFSFLEKEESGEQATLQRGSTPPPLQPKSLSKKATRGSPSPVGAAHSPGTKPRVKTSLTPGPLPPGGAERVLGESRAQGVSLAMEMGCVGWPVRDLVHCRPRPWVGLRRLVQWGHLVGREVGWGRPAGSTSPKDLVYPSEWTNLCGSTGTREE